MRLIGLVSAWPTTDTFTTGLEMSERAQCTGPGKAGTLRLPLSRNLGLVLTQLPARLLYLISCGRSSGAPGGRARSWPAHRASDQARRYWLAPSPTRKASKLLARVDSRKSTSDRALRRRSLFTSSIGGEKRPTLCQCRGSWIVDLMGTTVRTIFSVMNLQQHARPKCPQRQSCRWIAIRLCSTYTFDEHFQRCPPHAPGSLSRKLDTPNAPTVTWLCSRGSSRIS
jgi:hypothetical protein